MKKQRELAGAIIIPGVVAALFTITMSVTQTALGQVGNLTGAAPSPIRPPHLSAEEIMRGFLRPASTGFAAPTKIFEGLIDSIPFPPENPMETPMDRKVHISKASFAKVPEWNDMGAMLAAFARVRDARTLVDRNEFFRRPTWLYPDDGCYSRAELMSIRFENQKAPAPAKVFIFGNLLVKTPNTQNGTVEWWYHVVVAYKHQGTIFVIDPSVDPRKIMTLQALAQTLGNPPNLEVAVCGAHTYGPTDPCERVKGDPKAQAIEDQKGLFELEWTRLRHLGRNPYKELGDYPPWKAQAPPISARTRK